MRHFLPARSRDTNDPGSRYFPTSNPGDSGMHREVMLHHEPYFCREGLGMYSKPRYRLHIGITLRFIR